MIYLSPIVAIKQSIQTVCILLLINLPMFGETQYCSIFFDNSLIKCSLDNERLFIKATGNIKAKLERFNVFFKLPED